MREINDKIENLKYMPKIYNVIKKMIFLKMNIEKLLLKIML